MKAWFDGLLGVFALWRAVRGGAWTYYPLGGPSIVEQYRAVWAMKEKTRCQ